MPVETESAPSSSSQAGKGPKKAEKKPWQPTVVKPFNLSVSRRLEERSKFATERQERETDREKRERELRAQKERDEKKAMRDHRRTLDFKANPVRNYTSGSSDVQKKPPTVAHSPRLASATRAVREPKPKEDTDSSRPAPRYGQRSSSAHARSVASVRTAPTSTKPSSTGRTVSAKPATKPAARSTSVTRSSSTATRDRLSTSKTTKPASKPVTKSTTTSRGTASKTSIKKGTKKKDPTPPADLVPPQEPSLLDITAGGDEQPSSSIQNDSLLDVEVDTPHSTVEEPTPTDTESGVLLDMTGVSEPRPPPDCGDSGVSEVVQDTPLLDLDGQGTSEPQQFTGGKGDKHRDLDQPLAPAEDVTLLQGEEDSELKPQDDESKPQDDEFKSRDEDFEPHGDEFKSRDEDIEPHNDEFHSRDEDIEPHGDEFNSRDEDLEPHDDEFKSRDEEFEPHNDEFKSRDEEFEPQDDEFKSRDEEFKPQDDESKPEDDEFKSQDDEFKPQDDEFKPQDDEFKPQDDDFVRDDALRQNDDEFKPQDNFRQENEGGEYQPDVNVQPQEMNLEAQTVSGQYGDDDEGRSVDPVVWPTEVEEANLPEETVQDTQPAVNMEENVDSEQMCGESERSEPDFLTNEEPSPFTTTEEPSPFTTTEEPSPFTTSTSGDVNPFGDSNPFGSQPPPSNPFSEGAVDPFGSNVDPSSAEEPSNTDSNLFDTPSNPFGAQAEFSSDFSPPEQNPEAKVEGNNGEEEEEEEELKHIGGGEEDVPQAEVEGELEEERGDSAPLDPESSTRYSPYTDPPTDTSRQLYPDSDSDTENQSHSVDEETGQDEAVRPHHPASTQHYFAIQVGHRTIPISPEVQDDDGTLEN